MKKTGKLLWYENRMGIYSLLTCLLLLTGCLSSFFVYGKSQLVLTREEKEYIRKAGEIGVLVSPNKGTIQHMEGATGEFQGISIDVLDEIGDMTGLTFHYINGMNMETMTHMLDTGQAQLMAGLPSGSSLEEIYQLDLSESYLTSPISAVMRRGSRQLELNQQKLALPPGLLVDKAFQEVKEVVRYDSIEECIHKVAEGKADFTYGNAYVMEYYTQDPKLKGLTVFPLNGRWQKLCIGVGRKADKRLFSILNKAILALPDSHMQNIIMNNTARAIEHASITAIIAANPMESIAVFFGVIFFILLTAFFLVRGYREKNRQIDLINKRYTLMAEISNDYFYEYNLKEDKLVLSPDAAELFGIEPVLSNWHQRSGEIEEVYMENQKLSQLYQNSKANDEKRTFRILVPLKNGKKRWFRIVRAAIYEGGELVHVIGKMTDIQNEQEEKDLLLEKSRRDSLTRLYNAQTCREMISNYLMEHRSVYGSLFIMDIDKFKLINDTCGHYTGDKVLKEIGMALTETFRAEDIIGRLGGDEFIIMVKKLSGKEDISNKCAILKQRIGKIQTGSQIPVTVSIGVANAERESTFELLYQQADQALYQAKKSGRNTFKIWSGREEERK